MEMEHPNYYSNIPADVRYDRELSPNAKLLYSELTALTNTKGYAWPNNKYFADLYDVSDRTVREWLSQLEDCGHIKMESDKGQRLIYVVKGGWKKTSGGVEENFRGGWKKTSALNEEKSPKEALVEPLKDGNISPNTTLNTTYNRPSANFEEFMEAQGYKHDSIVDSDGGMAEWWEDDSGRKLSKSELKTLRAKWNPPPPPVLDSSIADTEKLVELIKRTLEKQYGSSPIIGNETKALLRQHLVKKYDKEFIREYAQWYFVDSSIEKKWRFAVNAFASEKFINSFLSER